MSTSDLALPDAAPSLHAGTNQMTWLVDGYTVALAALLLPAGPAGDRFGRRGPPVGGLALFSAASLAAVWISGHDPGLADALTSHARHAFAAPMNNACAVIGVIVAVAAVAVSALALPKHRPQEPR